MNRSSSTTISAELSLKLVVPQQTIVPLVASMYYSGGDPYAVRMAFHVGTDEPVEWIFARDLLAAGIESRQGKGDVQVWPSAVSAAETGELDVMGAPESLGIPGKVLNIELSSPWPDGICPGQGNDKGSSSGRERKAQNGVLTMSESFTLRWRHSRPPTASDWISPVVRVPAK